MNENDAFLHTLKMAKIKKVYACVFASSDISEGDGKEILKEAGDQLAALANEREFRNLYKQMKDDDVPVVMQFAIIRPYDTDGAMYGLIQYFKNKNITTDKNYMFMDTGSIGSLKFLYCFYFDVQSVQSGGCFIATATYGSYDHPTVLIYRNFRDKCLATSLWGNVFVQAYYKLSPRLTRFIERSPLIRRICTRLLDFLAKVIIRGFSNNMQKDRHQ